MTGCLGVGDADGADDGGADDDGRERWASGCFMLLFLHNKSVRIGTVEYIHWHEATLYM